MRKVCVDCGKKAPKKYIKAHNRYESNKTLEAIGKEREKGGKQK